MVHLLHSLLSVPVVIYSTVWRLFACLVGLPEDRPPVADIPVEAFVVHHTVHAILWSNHLSHLWASPLLN